MTYKIAVDGCVHLGYAAHGMVFSRRHGWNQRVVDGHVAATLITDQMLADGCTGHISNGDVFHVSRPLPRDVEFAHRRDDREHAAKLWRIINSGNHDAGSGSEISAAATLHRPALGAHAIYPNSRTTIGPHPGLYEIHQPDPALPIYLHLVSHYGLDPRLADRGITIDPQPVPDAINVFLTHGIAVTEDALYEVADRHGENRVIPTDWLTRDWSAVVLSDFHNQEPITGLGRPIWWTGSSLRRGWSDDPGDRGWLRLDIDTDSGTVQIVPRHIWQRPQIDLPTIDAVGATVDQINALVRQRLAEIDWNDQESADLTGHGGPIVRQRISGATPQQRQGINALAGQWAAAASLAAHWSYKFDNPRDSTGGGSEAAVVPLTETVRDFEKALTDRSDRGSVRKAISNTPTDLREDALARARAAIRSIRTIAED